MADPSANNPETAFELSADDRPKSYAPPDWFAYSLFGVSFSVILIFATNLICKVYGIGDYGELAVAAAVLVTLVSFVVGHAMLTRGRFAQRRAYGRSSSRRAEDDKRPYAVRLPLMLLLILPVALVTGAIPALIGRYFGITGTGQHVFLGLAIGACAAPIYVFVMRFTGFARSD